MDNLIEYKRLCDNKEKLAEWMSKAVPVSTLKSGDTFRSISSSIYIVIQKQQKLVWARNVETSKSTPFAGFAMVQPMGD